MTRPRRLLQPLIRLWKPHQSQILLFACIVVGVLVRLIGLSRYLWLQLGYDESRNMLVARHFVQYGEWLWRGPLTGGGNQLLLNSPAFYYLLSILWMLTRSPYGMMVAWMMLFSSIIYFVYRTAKNLWDWKTGIIAATITAIHPEYIFFSRQIQQPYLMTIIIAVLCTILTSQMVSTISLSAAIIILFLGLHLSYTAFLIIPGFAVWIISRWVKHVQKERTHLAFYGPIIVALLSLESWLFITYHTVLFDQFFQIFQHHQPVNMLIQMLSAAQSFTDLLWEINQADLTIYAAIMVGILCISILYLLLRRSKKFPSSQYIWIILITISSFIIAGRYPGYIIPSYLTGVLTLGVIIISVTLRWVYAKNKILGALCIIFVIGYFISHSYYRQFRDTPVISNYETTRAIATVIYRDFNKTNANTYSKLDILLNQPTTNFGLAFISPGASLALDDWQTGSLWFTLEILFNRRLVRLSETTDVTVNFVPLQISHGVLYLVCDRRIILPSTMIYCAQRLSTLLPTLRILTVRELYRKDPYILWRLTTKTPTTAPY